MAHPLSPTAPRTLHRRPGWRYVLLGFVLAGVAARAQMANRGELLLADDFRDYAHYTRALQPVKDGWKVRVAHGTWTRSPAGVESTWTAGHTPVLVFEGPAVKDLIVEVDFRYRQEPGHWAGARVSATNTALDPRAYAVSVWANQNFDSRATGLVLEHDEWSDPITRVNRARASFKPDTWYTLRLEVVGDEAYATCNGVSVHGRFDKFGLPKTSIWLATGQSPHELRHLRVYRATRNPSWVPTRSKQRPDAAAELRR